MRLLCVPCYILSFIIVAQLVLIQQSWQWQPGAWPAGNKKESRGGLAAVAPAGGPGCDGSIESSLFLISAMTSPAVQALQSRAWLMISSMLRINNRFRAFSLTTRE
jgi:hypothetical protein